MTKLMIRRTSPELPQRSSPEEHVHWMNWDPFRQMVPFWGGEEQPAHFRPDFDIKETKDGFVFKVDVPGIQEKDLEITLTGSRLTISGKRAAEVEEGSNTYYARECPYGFFTRAFTLPDGTDGNNHVRAELSQGVLTLLLPKRPELQPRRIDVVASEKPLA